MSTNVPMTDRPFDLHDLDYDLPSELIAQHPPDRREDARLLVLKRSTSEIIDARITDLPRFLRPGDLAVFNDTKVIPAKFIARRRTGGKVEGLFVDSDSPGQWRVMLKGANRVRIGESILLDVPESTCVARSVPRPSASGCLKSQARNIAHEDNQKQTRQPVKLTLLQNLGEGFWLLVPDPMNTPEHILNQYGQTPLPPYIQRNSEAERVARAESNPDSTGPTPADFTDRDRYQTVYAQKTGAIAAPTAGLHFTAELLQKLHADGISTAFVTLHVGLGTFKPISAPTLREHRMHSERFEVPQDTAAAIQSARQTKGRIVAVGTTTVRTLETLALRCDCPEADNSMRHNSFPKNTQGSSEIRAASGSTDIFIYPPYSFRLTDALLTNFHLPKSTLLALVMAFAEIETTRRAYRHAVQSRYRFFSFGDAMLII